MTEDNDAFEAAFGDDVPEDQAVSEPAPEAETPPATEEEAVQADQDQKPDEVKAEEPPAESGDKIEPREETPSPVPGLSLDDWKAHLDEREKRQKAESERAELERQLQTLRQQHAQKPESPPDVFDDPDGFRQYQSDQMTNMMLQQKMQQSTFFAEQQHGQEAVKEALAWAQSQPEHMQIAWSQQPSPVHAALDAMKQSKAAEQLRAHDFDIDKLVEARLAERQQSAAPQAPPPPKEPLPPGVKSGGVVKDQPKPSEEMIFHSVFN